jgi:Flp pilus assembly protein TadG
MTMSSTFLCRLARDQRGSTLIETAIVTPVLLVMALGTFDVSQMVAQQHRLQNGAADAESIVLAVASGTATNTTAVRTALANSLNLPESKVAVSLAYRCNAQTTLSVTNDCGVGQRVSTYVRVQFTDTYTPKWTDFGVGRPINYNVRRTIQVS